MKSFLCLFFLLVELCISMGDAQVMMGAFVPAKTSKHDHKRMENLLHHLMSQQHRHNQHSSASQFGQRPAKMHHHHVMNDNSGRGGSMNEHMAHDGGHMHHGGQKHHHGRMRSSRMPNDAHVGKKKMNVIPIIIEETKHQAIPNMNINKPDHRTTRLNNNRNSPIFDALPREMFDQFFETEGTSELSHGREEQQQRSQRNPKVLPRNHHFTDEVQSAIQSQKVGEPLTIMTPDNRQIKVVKKWRKNSKPGSKNFKFGKSGKIQVYEFEIESYSNGEKNVETIEIEGPIQQQFDYILNLIN